MLLVYLNTGIYKHLLYANAKMAVLNIITANANKLKPGNMFIFDNGFIIILILLYLITLFSFPHVLINFLINKQGMYLMTCSHVVIVYLVLSEIITPIEYNYFSSNYTERCEEAPNSTNI